MKKRPVIKLLKKILLILIPGYIIWFVYIEFMPMYYNKPTNTRWYFIKQALEKKHEISKSDIIFLGESRVNAAVDLNQIPNSYSFASGGATPIEMFYILKKYTENYSVPDTVFFSISPRFMSETFAFYSYAVRNNLFNCKEFNEICSHLINNETTLGKYPKLQFLLYKLNYIEYYQSDVMYNYVFSGLKTNKELIAEMTDMKGGRPHPDLKDSCSLLNYEINYEHFIPASVLTFYTNLIFNFCEEKNIHLIFDFIPMNESSYNALKPAFIEEYRYFIRQYSKKYPLFQISDTIYSYPDKYFGDESHMNSKGKVKYTEYLKEKYFNN